MKSYENGWEAIIKLTDIIEKMRERKEERFLIHDVTRENYKGKPLPSVFDKYSFKKFKENEGLF